MISSSKLRSKETATPSLAGFVSKVSKLTTLREYKLDAWNGSWLGTSFPPQIRTPLLVMTISPGFDPSTLPPVSAARSTITVPSSIASTIAAVIKRGAVRPGTAAVVITTCDLAIYGVRSSRCFAARSSVISRA